MSRSFFFSGSRYVFTHLAFPPKVFRFRPQNLSFLPLFPVSLRVRPLSDFRPACITEARVIQRLLFVLVAPVVEVRLTHPKLSYLAFRFLPCTVKLPNHARFCVAPGLASYLARVLQHCQIIFKNGDLSILYRDITPNTVLSVINVKLCAHFSKKAH